MSSLHIYGLAHDKECLVKMETTWCISKGNTMKTYSTFNRISVVSLYISLFALCSTYKVFKKNKQTTFSELHFQKQQ